MLINLILLAMLIWAFMIGYSRGLILQAIYSVGTLIAAVIAAQHYKALASLISQWVPFASATENSHLTLFNDRLLFHLDDAFYAGVAFMAIFIVIYVIVRLIGLFLHFSPKILGRAGKIIAGLLALFATYFALQMFFVTLSLVPLATIQTHLESSALVRLMVLHTPISSHILQNLFIENITKLNPLN